MRCLPKKIQFFSHGMVMHGNGYLLKEVIKTVSEKSQWKCNRKKDFTPSPTDPFLFLRLLFIREKKKRNRAVPPFPVKF
jgi:hypothetical protein